MKKLLVRILIGVVVLLVLAVVGIGIFLDGIAKRGIETVGPQITKVSVKLDGIDLSPLSGGGTVKGLVVGNPEGFTTPQAISVGSATLSLKPMSLLADKLVIRKIEVIAPEITFEGGFKGNNLSQILANVNEAAGGTGDTTEETEEAATRKLQVDDFLIRDAKLHVSITGMGGKTFPVALPPIHIENLGQGPDGITTAELVRLVLSEVEKYAVQAAEKGLAELGASAGELRKGLEEAAGTNAAAIGSKIGELLKKK
ncbi:MAG TPA: hypothetical protein GYA07_11115 [Verrucomicrobia bacterium]|nr:hypothetical protein [Verrucomicrobiota bacterium]HOP98963.1 hypothetical protein [Verrucomicrobiota bacterium]